MKILRLNEQLNENMIEEINGEAPILLELKNTVGLTPYLLSKLDPRIQIRLYGAQDEKLNKKYGSSEVFENTTYSIQELSDTIEVLEEIEKNIQPNWTDLEKSLYTYITLESMLGFREDKEFANKPEYNGVYSIVKGAGTSKGIANLYKEAMDRQGVPCRLISRGSENAWNEIKIDGVYYPLDLAKDIIYHSDVKNEGLIGVCNFLTDEQFYENSNHFVSEQQKKSVVIAREKIERALAVIAESLNEQKTEIKESPTIRLKSKSFQGIASEAEVTREVASSLQDLKITIDASEDKEVLKEDITQIGKFYPELLRNIEIESTSATRSDVQEVIDEIFDARRSVENTPEASENFTLTITGTSPEDFAFDFSKAPRAQRSGNTPTESKPKQRIVFKNTGNAPILIPDLRDKISANIGEVEFEGFDFSGFSLGGSSVEKIIVTGNNTRNLGAINPASVTAAFEVNNIPQAEFNDFITNILPTATHLYDLEISHQNLSGRSIFREIARNPNIVRIDINNSRLNNLDGIELFNGRIARLSLENNNLTINDLPRLFNLKRNNPHLDYSFMYNNNILNAFSSAHVSNETIDFLADYFYGNGYHDPRPSKRDALDLLLTGCDMVPYYIKDARVFREDLNLTLNPMMLKRDDEIDSINFNETYLQGGVLLLTVSQIERLIASGKVVPQEVRIKINDVSDLDSNKARDLMNQMASRGMVVSGVQVISDKNDGERSVLAPYSMSEYVYLRDTLDMIIDGIDPSDSDLDKFAVIYQRIIDSISYDNDAITHNDRASSLRYAELINSSRSLLGGLRDGTCVCVGYADILKNALALVGIDSKIVRGLADSSNPDSVHDWNLVLLDDGTGTKRWYYTDATWDTNKGVNRHGHPNPYNYTLLGSANSKLASRQIWTKNNPTPSSRDYDRIRVAQAFARARGMSFDATSRRQAIIPIAPDPTNTVQIDDAGIRSEFKRRKNDMYAKFYGDRDYQREYTERMTRYKSHEVERTDGTYTYRTIEDYAERLADEQFLLLDRYRECLERLTKYNDGLGDTSVYSSDPATRDAQIARDREYIETNNHAFNQHRDTQMDLATLGKYGERMPYIPRQAGLLRNVGRVALNALILARNIVAPVYRVIGRFVAQPIHRLIFGRRDATPYRNNFYHRMVARRDYFADKANADNPGHPIINGITSRFNAIFRAREGNEAVLRAGAKDIADNIRAQERESAMLRTINATIHAYEVQIQELEDNLRNNPYAANKEQVKAAIEYKKLKLKAYTDARDKMPHVGDEQTDAISDKEHAVASKEVNTMRTTAIKGVLTGLAVKYLGPKIHEWMLARGKSKTTRTVPTKEWVPDKEWVEPKYRSEPVFETVLDTEKSIHDLISLNRGQKITGYYSVYGGPYSPQIYTLTGNEKITGIFRTIGNGGTGFSDKVGLTATRFTDKVFPDGMLTGTGYLNQELSVSQLLGSIKSGTTKLSDLEGMYVSLNDQYWTDLPTLMSKLLTKVKVREDLVKIADGYFKGGYVYGSEVIEEEVMNPIVQGIADASVIAGRAAVGADIASMAGENLRRTHTRVKSNKRFPRDYRFDDLDIGDVPQSRREYHDYR